MACNLWQMTMAVNDYDKHSHLYLRWINFSGSAHQHTATPAANLEKSAPGPISPTALMNAGHPGSERLVCITSCLLLSQEDTP